MNISNKVLVIIYLEDGCSQERGECNIKWRPLNFDIYSELFPNLIYEAIDDWLSENKVGNRIHEVIFSHKIECCNGGVMMDEYFDPIHHESMVL